MRLRNDLAEPTNVHWHGLVVPAEADGHPMDLLAPGTTRDIAFTAPSRGGTFWYHPHPDRRTAAQVYQGMAGFLLVEDGVDRALGLPSGDRDIPVLLQDRRRRTDGSFTYAPSPMDTMAGYLGDVALANGTPDAYLSVSASPYRLRLLNGSNARVFRIGFDDGRAFFVVAGDGGLLERPATTSAFNLGPGERAEIVVDFSADSLGRSVSMRSLGFGSSGMGMGGSQGAALSLLRFDVDRQTEAAPWRPPALLDPIARFDPAAARRRRPFLLQMGMPPFAGAFTINGQSFRAGRVDVRVPRGELELWEIENGSTEPHPFHVHAAQFQMVSRSNSPLGPHESGWKDTMLVWPNERVQILLRFDGPAGLFVLHCHNLEHEDAGMMLNLEVA